MMDHGNQPFNDLPLQSNLTKPETSRFSRRAALIGVGCLIGGGLCVGGGTAAFSLAQTISNSFSGRSSKSSGSALSIYRGHSCLIDVVAWSPDSQHIASAGTNTQVWDAFNGIHSFTFTDSSRVLNLYPGVSSSDCQQSASNIYAVAWSPDGQLIAIAFTSIVGTKPPDSNGNVFFIYGYNVQVWNAITGIHICTYTGHSDGVGSIAWSPDGKQIASTDTNTHVWNATNGKRAYIQAGAGIVVWSSDGKRIFRASGSVSAPKTIESWVAADGSGDIIYPVDLGVDSSVAWSPDQQRLTAYSVYDSALKIWQVSTGKLLGSYQVCENSVKDFPLVYTLTWSPDGRFIAFSSDDKTEMVQICDAATGRNVFTYTGHTDKVTAVAWSPDGNIIASASDDKTVQVWSPD